MEYNILFGGELVEFRAVTLAGMRRLFGDSPSGWPTDGRTEVIEPGFNEAVALSLIEWANANPPTDAGKAALAAAWDDEHAKWRDDAVTAYDAYVAHAAERQAFLGSSLGEGRSIQEALAEWRSGGR